MDVVNVCISPGGKLRIFIPTLKYTINDEYVIENQVVSSHLGSVMGQIRDDNILLGITLVLKELRDMKGVSQEDVYNETNIHIGRIESANTNLTVSTLAELLKYFNIKFSDFFAKVENKEREFTKK